MGQIRKNLFLLVRNLLILAIASVYVFLSLPLHISADETIYLNINSNSEEVHAGDVVTINVTASQLHNITRFGPIDIGFNRDFVQYVSLWQPTELAAFTYDVDTSTENHIIVSAVDSVVEEDLSIDSTNDNSVYIDDELILFSISLRMNTNAVGDVRVWIESASGFTNSSSAEYSSVIGDGVTIGVAPSLSDDATLMSMNIDSVTLSPEFNSGVFEYTASVGRDIEAVIVNSVASNLWSSVEINGADSLEYGENVITIDVTAQDGVTVNQYKIYITRQDNTIAEGAGFVDFYGKIYTFLDMPTNYDIPSSFYPTTRVINGYSVNVFAREGVSSVLVYLYDGENEPSLYFYNPTTKLVTKYNSSNYTIMTSRVLSVVKLPEIISVPEGFSEGSLVVDGVEISGYVNNDGVFIAYMRDEEGNAEFYRYNEETGRFVDYKSVTRTTEKIYKLLFHIFIALSILEAAAIIIIVCFVRRLVLNRLKPRPRRV